jgi:phosphatidylserine/phosphatidylglycerophosphate/cardiolipin synthase-like enzyme
MSCAGIKVGYYPQKDKDFLMHNKFVIFDGEACMTGSLNWTLDVISNCQL